MSEREIIAEDLYSLLILYKSVKCVSILHESLYYYCENKSSLTHTYREDRYERIKEFYVKTINKAMDLGYSSEIVERIRLPYRCHILMQLQCYSSRPIGILCLIALLWVWVKALAILIPNFYWSI